MRLQTIPRLPLPEGLANDGFAANLSVGMNKAETATTYFLHGYNCAQATLAACAPDLGLDEATALRAAAGFGAGVGGRRETCGAVSAMVIVAGMVMGDYAPGDTQRKRRLYETVRHLYAEFTRRHGGVVCKELLARASCTVPSTPSERSTEYYAKRPCAHYVASATAILEQSGLLGTCAGHH